MFSSCSWGREEGRGGREGGREEGRIYYSPYTKLIYPQDKIYCHTVVLQSEVIETYTTVTSKYGSLLVASIINLVVC